jgi:hypothetical protein
LKPRRIAPDYSFRFTAEDIRATYGSAEAAFARGDFLNASQLAAPGSDLRGCALVLGGLLEQGLEILDASAEIGGPGQLCRAFALWSLRREAEAAAALRMIDDPDCTAAAHRFESLLARDDIRVFVTGAILSIFPEHNTESFTAPSYKYGAITAKYVASQMPANAYEYDPSQPFDRFIDSLEPDERPDILFALSPQWLLAKGFENVTVPKVVWCHDTDAFHYRNVDNYALYDVAICNCSQEHFELSQGTPGLFCAANMLLHPLATPFPEASPHRTKDFDIIFTGSALAPFHSEKPRFLYKLAELGADFNVRVVEGHLPEKDYFELVSHAKFLPVVNRYAGSPSPRWRDALANGSFLLYPEGSFYGEIAPGCFPYRADTMVSDIRLHLERFEDSADPAYDLSTVVPVVNERFAIHRQPREESFERLLKYALFTALVWRQNKTPEPQLRRPRRLVWLTPAVDCGLFGTNHVRDKIAHIAAHIGADDLLDEIDYNNAGHLHAQMVFTFGESGKAKAWADQADRYFSEGLARYPDSLLLRFNAAHWSFFKPKAGLAAAAGMFREIIDRFDRLSFDSYGADVAFAYTLHERDPVFPCYEYADVATTEAVLRYTPELHKAKTVEHSTRRIMLSACHGYVGQAKLLAGDHEGGLASLRQGIAIYPHGLPLLRLYFDTLLKKGLDEATFVQADAAALAAAFVSVVNVNPSVLLTHVFIVVPLLAGHGEEDEARKVVESWYRLANIIHSVRAADEQGHLERLAVLWNYSNLLPAALRRRIDAAMRDEAAQTRLTQLEQRLVSVARDAAERRRAARRGSTAAAGAAVSRIRLRSLLAGRDLVPERIAAGAVYRGAALWMRTPADVKLLYANKALRMALRGELKRTFLRVQQWSVDSKWARGEALNRLPRARRKPLFGRWRRLHQIVEQLLLFWRRDAG